MGFEDLKQQIELFFNAKASAEAIQGLERFKEDKYLINIIGANLQGKDMRQVQIEHFSTLIDAIDGVICATYPVENPIEYCSLYMPALRGNRVPRFKKVLAHLNKVKELDARVPQMGINANANVGRENNYGENKEHLFVFDSSSYLSLIKKINDDGDKTKAPIGRRLEDLEAHLSHLNEIGFKPSNLLAKGYGPLLDHIEAEGHGPEPNIFSERAKLTTNIFKNMSEAGFEVEDKAVMNQIYEWAKTGQSGMLEKFQKLSQYLSKEAIMYMSGFHLKAK